MSSLQSSRLGEVVLNVLNMLVALTKGNPCAHTVPRCPAWDTAETSAAVHSSKGLLERLMPEGSGADGAQSCSKCCLLTRQEAAGPQPAVSDKHGALRLSHGGAESGMLHSISARSGCGRV